MRRIIYILLCTALFTSCQKEDHNGDLGGNWKLLQIEELDTDSIIDKRNEDCFWAIQLEMIVTSRINYPNYPDKAKGRFQHVGDSLFIQMHNSPAMPKEVGLYNHKDERFSVNTLDRNRMVLQSKRVVLTFRKF